MSRSSSSSSRNSSSSILISFVGPTIRRLDLSTSACLLLRALSSLVKRTATLQYTLMTGVLSVRLYMSDYSAAPESHSRSNQVQAVPLCEMTTMICPAYAAVKWAFDHARCPGLSIETGYTLRRSRKAVEAQRTRVSITDPFVHQPCRLELPNSPCWRWCYRSASR